jgi:hypothetical protein
MTDRPLAFAIVGLGFAGFLYGLLNPAAIKKSSESHYEKLGFDKQPIWLWRTLSAIGCIGAGIVLIALWKSN